MTENEVFTKGQQCPIYAKGDPEQMSQCGGKYPYCDLCNNECYFRYDCWHKDAIIPWGKFE